MATLAWKAQWKNKDGQVRTQSFTYFKAAFLKAYGLRVNAKTAGFGGDAVAVEVATGITIAPEP